MYRVARKSADLLRMSLVSATALMAICLLALVETTNRVEAASLPDNGKIAYSAHQGLGPTFRSDLYTVDPDGSNLTQLTDLSSADYAAWSPDGTKIAFASDEDIYTMVVDGSKLRMLASERSAWAEAGLAWSPDGEHLAFTAHGPLLHEIYTMDLNGSEKTAITNSPGEVEVGVDFSPDGSRICVESYETPGGIYVMNVDGSNTTRLTDYQGSGCAWSPDGTRIAYSYEQSPGQSDQDSDVYIMKADGSGKINLTKSPKAYEGSPSWSPDGTKITFSSIREGDSDIYNMDADGSDVVRVTKTPNLNESNPDWQPLTPESRSLTVHPPDTGGPSLSLLTLVASALLFAVGSLLHVAVKRRM